LYIQTKSRANLKSSDQFAHIRGRARLDKLNAQIFFWNWNLGFWNQGKGEASRSEIYSKDVTLDWQARRASSAPTV